MAFNDVIDFIFWAILVDITGFSVWVQNINPIASRNVETVCCLCHQKKDYISELY